MTREEARKRLEVYLICAQCPEDKECYDSYLHSTCEYNDCREEVSLSEAIRTAIKTLEQEPKTWIPVSERLPYNHEYIQNNGLFNVSDGDRSYSEWFDIYDTQKFGEPTITGFRVDYAVTAWMPLPKSFDSQESEG